MHSHTHKRRFWDNCSRLLLTFPFQRMCQERWHDSYTCDMITHKRVTWWLTHVWHDSWHSLSDSMHTRVIWWPIHVRHDCWQFFFHNIHTRVAWWPNRVPSMCDMTHDMTQRCVWYDSWICVTWLMNMCDMTRDMTRKHGWRDPCSYVPWLVTWRDSSTCVTSLIPGLRDEGCLRLVGSLKL